MLVSLLARRPDQTDTAGLEVSVVGAWDGDCWYWALAGDEGMDERCNWPAGDDCMGERCIWLDGEAMPGEAIFCCSIVGDGEVTDDWSLGDTSLGESLAGETGGFPGSLPDHDPDLDKVGACFKPGEGRERCSPAGWFSSPAGEAGGNKGRGLGMPGAWGVLGPDLYDPVEAGETGDGKGDLLGPDRGEGGMCTPAVTTLL